ncbi:MAG: hypothetical protein MI919_19355, partial [Holophagales bacterium]|nr:hypothetical protein [Holophagales bacterium]
AAVLGFEDFRIVEIGSDLDFGIDIQAPGALTVEDSVPGDGVPDFLSLELGNVVNAVDSDDDPGDPDDRLVLEVDARVVDVPSNVGAGQDADGSVRNSAALEYSGLSFAAVADLDIVEPVLSLGKTLETDLVDAFDVVRVDLRIEHAAVSTAVAYRVIVRDDMPAPAASYTGLVSEDCPGAVDVDLADPESDVTFSLAEPLTLGQGCTLSYEMTVGPAVEPATTYEGVATLEWDSTPAGEAAGALLNRRGLAAVTGSFTILAPTLVKVVTATDFDPTGSVYHNPGRTDLTIGEEVCYEVEAYFPEGVTPSVSLADLLPTGSGSGMLGLTSAALLETGANLSFDGTGQVTSADEVAGDGILDTVRVDLGTVTNGVADNQVGPGDRVLLQVCAVLLDEADNVDGRVVTNKARLSFSGAGLQTARARAEVVSPSISLDKQFVDLESDVATIRLELGNEGTAPAYDLEILDTLTDATWSTGSIEILAVAEDFLAETRDSSDGSTVAFVSGPGEALDPGQSVAFLFRAPIQPSVIADPDSEITNLAVNTLASTLPGVAVVERELDAVEASAVLGYPRLEVRKTASLVADNDASGHVSPGDTVRYELRVENVGGGIATEVVLVDQPDDLTTVIPESISTSGEAVWSAPPLGQWRITFAALAAGASVTAVYDVSIDPMPLDVMEVSNQAEVSWRQASNGTLSDDPATPEPADPTRMPVVALPDLTIAVEAPATAVPGEPLAYLITWAHQGDRTARGVVLEVELPVDTTFDADASDGRLTCPEGVCALDLGTVVAGESGSVVLGLQASPIPDIANDTVRLQVSIEDDLSQGPDPTPENNQGLAETPWARPGGKALSLRKELSHAPQVSIGGSVVYEVVVTVPEASTVRAASLVDTISGNLAIESVGDQVVDSLLVVSPGAIQIDGGRVEWALGTIENPDLDPETDENIRMVVRSRLVNSAENQQGVEVSVPAELTWAPAGVDQASVQIEVVEPQLALRASSDPAIAVSGDEVTIRLQIHHSAGSGADAHDVTVREILPDGL